MSYCVECGVELADYHKKCPLCETLVNNPNRSFNFSKNDYPIYKKHYSVVNRRKVVRNLVGFILTMCFLMAAMIPTIIDFKINTTITWSVYPIISVLFLWISIAIPFFLKKNTFFRVFTLGWWAATAFIVLINIIIEGQFSWSKYVLSSMSLIWVLVAGIFIPSRIRKFVPVIFLYIVTSVGFFLLLASWIADTSAIFSLVLPLEGALLITFLVTYFIIRSKLHGVTNFIILFLIDILLLAISFDLIITRYIRGSYNFTWSFPVALALVPMIIVALIIHKRIHLQGVLSKKLHR